MFYYDKAKTFKIKGLTKIVMPSKKTGLYYALSPLSVIIIAAQIFGLYRNLSDYSEDSFGYIIYCIFIVALSLFNSYMIIFFLWTCWGKEIIEHDSEILRIKKTIFNLGYSKLISLNSINSITFNENPDYGILFIIKNGKISINTVDKTYNVGLGINNDNAKEVMSMLVKEVPNINK